MKIVSSFRCRLVVMMLFMLPLARAVAQSACVVADRSTGIPVAHVSLYANENGNFRSAITDASGRAVVNFPFRSLTVSHLNYRKIVLRRLADTVWVEPVSHQADEVVVSSHEPAWIRPLLKKVARNRRRCYLSAPLTLSYDYQTQSISSRRYYHFAARGLMKMRCPDLQRFDICHQEGFITGSDSTTLTDYMNLRRMIHEDFVDDFNNDFIREHRFAFNEDYVGGPGEVELAYRLPGSRADHGRFVVDTVRCVVLRATRTSSVSYNKKRLSSGFMLSLAKALSGYGIDVWDTYSEVEYAETDGVFHPVHIRYKIFFDAHESRPDAGDAEFEEQTGGGFANMEASVTLGKALFVPESPSWQFLPKSWYVGFHSETERAYEVALSHMPASFHLLTE